MLERDNRPAVKLELRHSLQAVAKLFACKNNESRVDNQRAMWFIHLKITNRAGRFDASSVLNASEAGWRETNVAGGFSTRAGNANQ